MTHFPKVQNNQLYFNFTGNFGFSVVLRSCQLTQIIPKSLNSCYSPTALTVRVAASKVQVQVPQRVHNLHGVLLHQWKCTLRINEKQASMPYKLLFPVLCKLSWLAVSVETSIEESCLQKKAIRATLSSLYFLNAFRCK